MLSSQGQHPTFEVATVKAVDPKGGFTTRALDHDRFVNTASLLSFIGWAYQLRSACGMKIALGEDCPLITGALPAWTKKDPFEVQAKMPDNSPTYTGRQFSQGETPQLDLMLQSLLEERFKLSTPGSERAAGILADRREKRTKLKQAAGPEMVKAPDGSSVPFRAGCCR